MPLALSRDQLAPVSLRSDQDQPEETRPAFLFFHLTRREIRQVNDWWKQFLAATTNDEAEALLDKIILAGLAGWRHMRGRDGTEIAFDPARMDDLLTTGEKVELAQSYPEAVQEVEAK